MAKPKRPRDTNQLAKLLVSISTGEFQEQDPNLGKDIAAINRGRLGGIKGGKARAEKLNSAQRKQSARKAAIARWKNKKPS